MLAAVPFFHAIGIIVGLRFLMCLGTIVQLPSEKLLNAGLVIDVIKSVKLTSSIFPPSIQENITVTPNGIKALSKLEIVFY
jgi:acyl-CoA synthetase (AMP-forming)/AMP-acid ligase II